MQWHSLQASPLWHHRECLNVIFVIALSANTIPYAFWEGVAHGHVDTCMVLETWNLRPHFITIGLMSVRYFLYGFYNTLPLSNPADKMLQLTC